MLAEEEAAKDAGRAAEEEAMRRGEALLAELEAAGELERWLVVSRVDSTLRGHFPLEVEAIQAELGPFDATLLAPAFLPGGRTTRGAPSPVTCPHTLQGVSPPFEPPLGKALRPLVPTHTP